MVKYNNRQSLIKVAGGNGKGNNWYKNIKQRKQLIIILAKRGHDSLRTVRNLQGDSGGICNTLGNDNMCDSKQKSSYEHGSNFERLPRYGKKKIRTILRARTAIT